MLITFQTSLVDVLGLPAAVRKSVINFTLIVAVQELARLDLTVCLFRPESETWPDAYEIFTLELVGFSDNWHVKAFSSPLPTLTALKWIEASGFSVSPDFGAR